MRRKTEGAITLDVESRYGDAAAWDDKEQAVLAAVAAGDADLAWVGAREPSQRSRRFLSPVALRGALRRH